MTEPQISSEAVNAKTGRTWEEWFTAMDIDGCAKMSHKENVALLRNKYQVEDWWQQMITVSYEQSRGKRLLHQRPNGYQISKSRTFKASIDSAFRAWTDECLREKWMANPKITIRKASKNHSLRITWIDDLTSLDVFFYPRGDNVQVSLNHSKLPDSQKAENRKKYWAEQLIKLADFLE